MAGKSHRELVRASKKERDTLRERMLNSGASRRIIKDEMMRRYGYRPRIAWRHAFGWTQNLTATMYNDLHDKLGNAPMTESRIGAYERWPDSGERPSVFVLANLAKVFGTTIDQLMDADDFDNLRDLERHALSDLLRREAIDGTPQPHTPLLEFDHGERAGKVVYLRKQQ